MLQAIVFDHDGTLAQTMERQYEWFKFYSKIHENKWDFKNVKSFIPFYNDECNLEGGVQNVYDSLNLPCDMNDREHPVWDAYEHFKKITPAPLYGGIKETVEEIWKLGHLSKDYKRNKRLRLGINTTNTWKSVYSDLNKSGLIHCFDSFITEEVLRDYHGAGAPNSIKKPSKISLALALGLIDSEGEYTIHVGDTLNDLSASQKVVRLNPLHPETLITVGVGWGYEGKENLEKGIEIPGEGKAYFNHIIEKPSELVNIVKKYLKK